MMKGEPLPLFTIVNGLVWFLIVQIFGVFYSGIFGLPPTNVAQLHFLSVFLGWLAFVVYGSELQMSRAFTALRKFQPEPLRWLFILCLNLGLTVALLGTYMRSQKLVILGLLIYLIGNTIHLIWLTKRRSAKLFKFPLGYHLIAQYIFTIALVVLILNSLIGVHGLIQHRNNVGALLSVAWITLVLTGTMIRILPMFVGKVIDREARETLPYHLWGTILSVVILSTGLILYGTFFIVTPLLWIGVILWAIIWVWTVIILFKSLTEKRRKTINRSTLLYFIPGIISFTIGSFFGILEFMGIGDSIVIRRLHIHISLVLGLSMIMLGAVHRITSFQIHSIIYSGRKTESPPIGFFLMEKLFGGIAVVLILSQIVLISGILTKSPLLFGIGGLLHLTASSIYFIGILRNYIFYLRNKKFAIPFDKKSSEV